MLRCTYEKTWKSAKKFQVAVNLQNDATKFLYAKEHSKPPGDPQVYLQVTSR